MTLKNLAGSSSDNPQYVSDRGAANTTLPLGRERNRGRIHIALIDSLRFSGDCLMRALVSISSDLLIKQFADMDGCKVLSATVIDILLYRGHGEIASETLACLRVRELKACFPSTPLIVISDMQNLSGDKQVRSVLDAGAQGFIPAQYMDVSSTLAAIRFVKDGGVFVPPDLLMGSGKRRSGTLSARAPIARLTQRERLVVDLLRKGMANKEIAQVLTMTENTVKAHLRNVMRKMGAKNRTHVVYLAGSQADPIDDF